MHYYAPVRQPDSCQRLREFRTTNQVAICRFPGLARTLPLTPGLGGGARHSVRAVSARNCQEPCILLVAEGAHRVTRPTLGAEDQMAAISTYAGWPLGSEKPPHAHPFELRQFVSSSTLPVA